MNLGERLSAFWKSFTGNAETAIAVITCIIVFSVLYFFIIKFLSVFLEFYIFPPDQSAGEDIVIYA